MDISDLLNQPVTPPNPPEPPEPPNENSARLEREQRIQILTLREAGFSYNNIVAQFEDITYNQVRYTCRIEKWTPRKAKGAPMKLSELQINEILAFISSSRRTRRLPFYKVIRELELPVNASTLARALAKRGYHRYRALRKPYLTAVHREARFRFARDHLHWTWEQWSIILWSDETWVKDELHKKVYVTRTAGEDLDDTCLMDRKKGKGWMFWGSFHGCKKGPALIWEKDWGTIDSESYCQKIVPIIQGYLRLKRQDEAIQLQFMQDNASSHGSKKTRAEMQARGIPMISWPSKSPDLNPIESIWDDMKDYVDERLPPGGDLSYERLKRLVQEAWDSISEDYLRELLQSMPARCQAIIEADGGPIRF
jgi:ketohexokinase/beta-glucosidase